MSGRLVEISIVAKLPTVVCSQGQFGSSVTKNRGGQGQRDRSDQDVQGSQGQMSEGSKWLS